MPHHGDPVWCDLSSYRPEVTRDFYQAIFGWHFAREEGGLARLDGEPVASIFEMPSKFQGMGMPSFWMSYVAVSDLDDAMDTVARLGGRVEIGPTPVPDGGRYALVRDPLGAGISLYDGVALSGGGNRAAHGLFVSQASSVMPFYEEVLRWRFSPVDGDVWQILAGEAPVGHLHQIADPSIRGSEEYWAVLFKGRSGLPTVEELQRLGGGLLAEVTLPEGPAVLAHDPDGAAFFVI